jgi:hypothetical protein
VSTYDYDKELETFRALHGAITSLGEAMLSLHATVSRMRIQTERAMERIDALEAKIEGESESETLWTREQIVAIAEEVAGDEIQSHVDSREHLDKDDITEILDDYLSDLRIERR